MVVVEAGCDRRVGADTQTRRRSCEPKLHSDSATGLSGVGYHGVPATRAQIDRHELVVVPVNGIPIGIKCRFDPGRCGLAREITSKEVHVQITGRIRPATNSYFKLDLTIARSIGRRRNIEKYMPQGLAWRHGANGSLIRVGALNQPPVEVRV